MTPVVAFNELECGHADDVVDAVEGNGGVRVGGQDARLAERDAVLVGAVVRRPSRRPPPSPPTHPDASTPPARPRARRPGTSTCPAARSTR